MRVNSQASQLTNTGHKLLRRPIVQDLTGLSKTSIWRLERIGKFPKSVQLTSRTVGYRESEILAWLISPTDYQLNIV